MRDKDRIISGIKKDKDLKAAQLEVLIDIRDCLDRIARHTVYMGERR